MTSNKRERKRERKEENVSRLIKLFDMGCVLVYIAIATFCARGISPFSRRIPILTQNPPFAPSSPRPCAEERAITNSHSEPPAFASRSLPFPLAPTISSPLSPHTAIPTTSFFLFHRGRTFLQNSHSLSFSFSLALSHESSILILALSSLSVPLFSHFSLIRYIRSFSLCARGYLIPREWKRGRKEWEKYIWHVRVLNGRRKVVAYRGRRRINGRTVKFWCSDNEQKTFMRTHTHRISALQSTPWHRVLRKIKFFDEKR